MRRPEEAAAEEGGGREEGARRCALGDHEMLLAEKKENQLFNQMLSIDCFLSIVCVCLSFQKKGNIKS